jgi:cell wall-associated NlpC family hydrolase
MAAGASYGQNSQRKTPGSDTVYIAIPKTDSRKASSQSGKAGIKKNGQVEIKEIIAGGLNEPEVAEGKDSLSAGDISVPMSKEPSPITTAKVTRSAEAQAYYETIDPVVSKYADMIQEDVHDINNYPLYRFIDQWYGARYKYGGTDMSGIDCSAFSQKLYEKVYGTDLVRTAKQQRKSAERIKDYDDAEEGDLVFFRIHRIRISHVGVYLANGYFVHASRSHGVTISNLDTPYWRRRYAGCGRVQKGPKAPSESEYTVSPTE